MSEVYDLSNVFTSVDEFRTIKDLGKGGYSIVKLVEHEPTGNKYALKCAWKMKEGKDKSYRTRTEIKVLQRLNHPNVVRLNGHFEDDETIYLVMDHLKGKDLRKYFKNTLPSERDAIYVLRQVAESIKYIHSQNIIHRDIKLENILIENGLNIKLTDFGLCAIKKNEDDYFTREVGTIRYTAPEILRGNGYDERVDIWGYGVVMFMLLTGKYPYDGSDREKIFNRITTKEIDYSKYNFHPGALDLIKRILRKNPKKRISIRGILRHPWMKGKWDDR